MKVGIVRFPGSNCDFDVYNWFRPSHEPFFIFHKETTIPEMDLLILPGGFAFGDRVYTEATGEYQFDPGTQALNSPVMESVIVPSVDKIPILGICNGFQILIKAGLLPGRLERNIKNNFICNNSLCKFTGISIINDTTMIDTTYNIPIAHGYGRYIAENSTIIFLKYMENVNGSDDAIAGVKNSKGTVFGMMPHPERSPHRNEFLKMIEKYINE